MKRVAWVMAGVAIGVLGYSLAGPYRTIHEIKIGIENGDQGRLSEYVEFVAVRQSLKEQLKARAIGVATGEFERNPLAAIVAGLATTLVDPAVDAFVTPAGLALVMQGRTPSDGSGRRGESVEPATSEDLLGDARYTYDGLSRFSVWVPTDHGKETRLVLERRGFSWRLVNILLPMEQPR
jgi:hypothetical protein